MKYDTRGCVPTLARPERKSFRVGRLAKYVNILAGLLFVLLTIAKVPAFSQTVTASLSGTVTDSTGAVIPGAKVVLTSDSTNVSQNATATSAGFFNFTGLLPGSYTLEVSAEGMVPWKLTGITLHQQEARSVSNIQLKVGMAKTEVTVVAEAAAPVLISSGQSSTTLNNTMVSQLAIQGRDAAELLRIMPGMAINSGPIGSFSASGTQPNGAMQLVMNGSVITDAGNQGTQIANINQDMTQEVTIQNAAFDAEHAHGPVTFSSTGKSGGAKFHGEGYVYTRNGSLNANNSLFNAKGQAKPIDHYWYPGANIGGPVLIPGTSFNKNHDKAFFFFGYEHMKQQPAGALHQYFIPTTQMIQGNFTQSVLAPYVFNGNSGTVPCADVSGFWNYSTYCQGAVDNGDITLFDPSGTAITPAAYDASITAGSPLPVAGAQVAAGAIDPNGQILMQLLASAPGLKAINPLSAANRGLNAQFLDNPPVISSNLNAKGDVNITDNIRAFVSFTRQPETDINNIGLWWWAPNAVPYPSQTPASQLSRAYSFGVTNIISPTMVNEATFGYAYFINPVTLKNPQAADPSTYGYNVPLPYTQLVPQIPDIVSWCCSPGGGGGSNSATTSAGFNASSFGTNPKWNGDASGKDSYTPDFSDTFSWTKGSHAMKFGFFWARYANVQTEGACCGGGTVGQWEFDPWAFLSTNNIYADMLLGHAVGYGQASTNFTDNVRYNEYDFFAQDSWKATSHLTISFGLRFERLGQWFPANENQGIMVWDPSTYDVTSSDPLTGFVWHGKNSNIPLSGWATHQFYPDPRFGVAYDLFGNGWTVLRGGMGLYRHQVAYNDVTENAMLDAPLGLQNFSSNCNFSSLSDLGSCSAAASGARNSLSYGGMLLNDNKSPHTINWDVMIDQRGPWHSMFEIQYQGNRARDLLLAANGAGGLAINNINWVPTGGLFNPDPVTGITYFCQGTASATCVTTGPPADQMPHFRPYDYNGLYLFRHGSYSNYHALMLQWMKQAGPAVFNINYTWSHAMGIRDGNNDNGQGSGASLDAFCLKCNYGVLAFNRAHIFNAGYTINLPSPIKGNVFAQGAINGWQLSGITQFQSGPPLQPLTGTGLNPSWPGGTSNQSILGTDGITLQPYLTCNPGKNLQSGQYFNPSCFTAPTTRGVNGPLIWPNIPGPGFFNSDLGIYKNFKIKESQGIQFRITAFNFLNHPLPQFNLGNDVNLHFAAPGGGNTNTDTTGKPKFTVGNRTVQLALKYTF